MNPLARFIEGKRKLIRSHLQACPAKKPHKKKTLRMPIQEELVRQVYKKLELRKKMVIAELGHSELFKKSDPVKEQKRKIGRPPDSKDN